MPRPAPPALILALLNTVAYGLLHYAQLLLALEFVRPHGWTRDQTALAFTLALRSSSCAHL